VQAVNRRIAAIAVLAAGLAGPALAAAPASAGSGTSSVGCTTGDSCTAMLEKMIQFSGANYSPGANNLVVDITPPACLWEPIGDAITGSQAITSIYGTDPAKATTVLGVSAAVQTAVTISAEKPPPAGEWYELPVNPDGTAAQEKACLAQPLYAWVPAGQAPPEINIPPQTLAQLAVAKMALPTAGAMILNPVSGRTYTNLPTYLQVALGGGYETTAGGMPYATVTATLGNAAATVWAIPSKLEVSASGGTQYKADTTDCGYLGSTQIDTAQAANAGPGTPIDCGATFLSPGAWQLTATMTWQACWAPVAGGDPPTPATCQPVPGAQLNGLNWTRPVTVNEIQSVNNGAG
jgi:hypothetical protein